MKVPGSLFYHQLGWFFIMETLQKHFCGNVSDGIKRLVKGTEECLERAIAVCKDGASFKKIEKRMSEHAEKYGFGVVEHFVGHGVGTGTINFTQSIYLCTVH